MNPTPDIVSSTIAERGRVYGEPHLSHENIGLAWTGLIQQHYGIRLDHPLPHWLVEQMLASFKIHRAAKVFHEDNYVDALAYLRFAVHGQAHPKQPYTEPPPSPTRPNFYLFNTVTHELWHTNDPEVAQQYEAIPVFIVIYTHSNAAFDGGRSIDSKPAPYPTP